MNDEKPLQKTRSFNQKKLGIDEIIKQIERMGSLNEMLRISFESYIQYNNKDIKELISLIKYLYYKFDYTSIKLIQSKNLKLNLNFDNYGYIDIVKQIAFFIYILNNIYYHQPSNMKFLQYFDLLFKIIKKFFREKVLKAEDLVFFIKYFMTLSTFTINDNFRIGKSIKKLMIFWLALNFFTSIFKDNQISMENKDYHISNIIDFIDSNFLVNNLNILMLSKSPHFLSLLEIIKNEEDLTHYHKLLHLVTKIYSNQYNMKLHKNIVNNIGNEYELHNIIRNLEIYSKLFNFFSLQKNSFLEIKNGFFFTNQSNSGIKISPILTFPSKGYTLIFSFKLIQNSDKLNEQTLILFQDTNNVNLSNSKENEATDLYRISIKNSQLNIKIFQESHVINFTFNKDEFYLVAIVQNGLAFFTGNSKLMVFINDSHNCHKIETNNYPKGKTIKGTIGYESKFEKDKFLEKMHFYGLFGTFLLFDQIFSNDLLKKMFVLKDNYELILYRNFNLNSGVNLNPTQIKVLKSLNDNDVQKISSLICLISPKSIFDPSLKSLYNYREDYGDFHNNNLCVTNRKFEILSNTCIFNLSKFDEQFIKFEGLSVLCYILKILNESLKRDFQSLLNQNEINNIWNILISVLESTFFNVINNNYLKQSSETFIQLLFYYLNSIINKLSFKKITNLSIFESLHTYLIIFEKLEQKSNVFTYLKIKYSKMIFDDKLYDLKSKELIKIILIKLKNYIDTQSDCIKLNYFKKILSYSSEIFQLKQGISNDCSKTIKYIINKFCERCISEEKIGLFLEVIKCLLESNTEYYRYSKFLKIFYNIIGNKDNLKFIISLVGKSKKLMDVVNELSTFMKNPNDCELYEITYKEKCFGYIFMIIDIFYFRIETSKISKNYLADTQKKDELLETLLEAIKNIQTEFLTKCLISLCINSKDREKFFSKFFSKNGISNENFYFELILEPTNRVLMTLNKINDYGAFKLIFDFFHNYFKNCCENKTKLKKNDLLYSIFSENSTCQIFYSFIFLNQNFIEIAQEMDFHLQNIFEYLVLVHPKPFCFEFILNLYLEKYDFHYLIDSLLIPMVKALILKKNNPNNLILCNIKNLLLLNYKMIYYAIEQKTQNVMFLLENFINYFILFIELLLDSQIIYFYSRVFQVNETSHKTLFEILFDLIFGYYKISKNEKILRTFENIYSLKVDLIPVYNSEETIFGILDNVFRIGKKKKKLKCLNTEFLKNLDTVFKDEKVNPVNYISIELLAKFIINYVYFRDSQDKNLNDFLKNLINSTVNDLFQIFSESFLKFEEHLNFINGKNKNEYNSIYQKFANDMFTFYKSNDIFENETRMNERFDNLLKFIDTSIKSHQGLLAKYFQQQTTNKIQDDQEIKHISTYQTTFDSREKTKESFGEKKTVKKFEDKRLDEIENSLHYTLSLTSKYLLQKKLTLFFREKFYKDPLFMNLVFKNYQEKYAEALPNIVNRQVFLKSMNSVVSGNSYFKPFLKVDHNFLHSKYISISHSYLSHLIEENKKFQTLNISKFCLKSNFDEIFQNYCELIKVDGVIMGKIFLTNEFLIFQSINENYSAEANQTIDLIFGSLESDIIEKNKHIYIKLTDIKEILIRRFLLMWQAFEIFLYDGRSYFFNIFRKKYRKMIFEHFKTLKSTHNYKYLIVNNSKEHFKKMEYTKKWQEGELTNFDYLCLINKYGGRTYEDLNQYPIFPWILSNYTSRDINLDDKDNFRNLNFPISAQTEEKRNQIMTKFEEEKDEKFKVHFRCHYATSAFVINYLIRVNPFSNMSIKLQNGKFDHPNRIFYNFTHTYSILEQFNDNRELIPEFFYSPDFLINNNLNYYGLREETDLVHDVELPLWAKNPVEFVHKNRLALESKIVSESLNLWIDNVFGCNQLAKNKDIINMFPQFTYEQEVNLSKKIKQYRKSNQNLKDIISDIRNEANTILNFGQTPHKLFDDKHPKRKKYHDDQEYLNESTQKKIKERITIPFQKPVKFFKFSKTMISIFTGHKDIELYEKNYKKKLKVRLKVSEKFQFMTKNKAKICINKESYKVVELKDSKIFISCQHLDNSIKVHIYDNCIDILMNSLVSCIIKSPDEQTIYTGHSDGKLCKWELKIENNNEVSLNLLDEVLAHEEMINSILINEKLNLIITGSDDGFISIRNLTNLNIINFIYPKLTDEDSKKYKIVDVKMSNFNWLYVQVYESNNFHIIGYSLSGLKFSSLSGNINNYELTKNGNLIVGFLENKINIYFATDFTRIIYSKNLDEIHSNTLYYFTYSEELKSFFLGYYDGNFKKVTIDEEKLSYFE